MTDLKKTLMCNSENHINQTLTERLAYGGDRVAIRHDSPGVAIKEATSMEEAWGKTQELL